MWYLGPLLLLFRWPIVDRRCGGVVMWSDRMLFQGDILAPGSVVFASGRVPRDGEEYGKCPLCWSPLPRGSTAAGWDLSWQGEAPHLIEKPLSWEEWQTQSAQLLADAEVRRA